MSSSRAQPYFVQLLSQGLELCSRMKMGDESRVFTNWLRQACPEVRGRSLQTKLLSQQTFNEEQAMDTLLFAAASGQSSEMFYNLARAVAKLHDKMEPHGDGARLGRIMTQHGLEIVDGAGSQTQQAHRTKKIVKHLERPVQATTMERVLQIRRDLHGNPTAMKTMGARSTGHADQLLWQHMLREMHVHDNRWWSNPAHFQDKTQRLIDKWPGVVEAYANKYGAKPGGGAEEREIRDAQGRSISVRFNEPSPSPERARTHRSVLQSQSSIIRTVLGIAHSLKLLTKRSVRHPEQVMKIYGPIKA
jgi:hypothetical protein